MYTFFIKDNGPDPDVLITRAMLALAAIASLVYRTGEYYFINLLSIAVLAGAAVFIKLLISKLRVTKFILLSGAAVVLFIATRSLAFAVILVVYGYLARFLYRKPSIEVTNNGIALKKLFTKPVYQWNEFSNVILKDNLLTLDYKNNKLLQVSIDENNTAVDENAFNDFCRSFI